MLKGDVLLAINENTNIDRSKASDFHSYTWTVIVNIIKLCSFLLADKYTPIILNTVIDATLNFTKKTAYSRQIPLVLFSPFNLYWYLYSASRSISLLDSADIPAYNSFNFRFNELENWVYINKYVELGCAPPQVCILRSFGFGHRWFKDNGSLASLLGYRNKEVYDGEKSIKSKLPEITVIKDEIIRIKKEVTGKFITQIPSDIIHQHSMDINAKYEEAVKDYAYKRKFLRHKKPIIDAKSDATQRDRSDEDRPKTGKSDRRGD